MNYTNSTIQAIIFDFGNVIAVPKDEMAWRTHLDQVSTDLDFANGAEMWAYLYEGEEWQLAKTGRISDAEFWHRLLAPRGLRTAQAQQEWVARLYGTTIGGVHPRMRELLHQLRGRYKLALLSNASDELATSLYDKHKLDAIFDVVVVSATAGMAKPDPAIYELTLERLDTPASRTLFIDDQTRNTRAAEELGIKTIVFPGVQELWEELEQRNIL
jgi:putative hydrolase of the HAD superfamily